jgi:hypothetical protein
MSVHRRGRKGPLYLYIPKGDARELTEPERRVAIDEFMTWLAGRMPSEAIRDEVQRPPLAIDVHMTQHAERYIRSARGRRRAPLNLKHEGNV